MFDLKEGVRYVLRHGELVFALTILLAISLLLRPVIELLPAFAARMAPHMQALPPEAVLSMLATIWSVHFVAILTASGYATAAAIALGEAVRQLR